MFFLVYQEFDDQYIHIFDACIPLLSILVSYIIIINIIVPLIITATIVYTFDFNKLTIFIMHGTPVALRLSHKT